MATHRPIFPRSEAERIPMQDMQDEERSVGSTVKSWEKQTIERQGTADSATTLPAYTHTATLPPVYLDEDGSEHFNAPAETAKDLTTEVIHAVDDPTLNPVFIFSLLFFNSRVTNTITTVDISSVVLR
jgi:hypothetical protein